MSRVTPSVFMIGWEYPPYNSGGLGVACEGLTQALSEQNVQAYFTLPYAYTGSVPHLDLLDCSHPSWAVDTKAGQPPFAAYSSQRESIPSLPQARFEPHLQPSSDYEYRVHQYADQVVAKAQQVPRDFDLIHAHDWMAFPAAEALKRETGKPMIAHIHSTELDRIPLGGGSQYIHATEKAGMAAADLIVAVSAYTKQLLIREYGMPADKIVVVHNGVTPVRTFAQPEIPFAADRPVIVFMGRLTMQKGGEYFIQLARQVARSRPDALFIVAGDGDLYRSLLFSTAKQGLSAQVLFSGFLRDRQQAQLLERADVFVMPSLSEPFGLVALEAAQRHTPVIVSKQSGVSEVLKNAIQLDFWDVAAMSSAVLELLDNRQYARQKAEAQLQDLKQAQWSRAAKAMKTIYQGFTGRSAR